MTERLDKTDWIAAGLKTLARDGIDAVRVERLAMTLKVTKGSFYWHFKDRQALLGAMLGQWQRLATNAIIDEVEAQGGTARERLRNLYVTVLKSDGRLDLAVRAWAASDKTASKALKGIDQKRITYVEGLFRELGFSKRDGAARAQFSYNALLGQYAMGHAKPGLGPDGQFDAIFRMLTRKPK